MRGRKMLGRSKRARRNREAPEHHAIPIPPLMTYDPYLIRIARRAEAARRRPKARDGH